MSILQALEKVYAGYDAPFLIDGNEEVRFADIFDQNDLDLSQVNVGDVVALIGDYNPQSIRILLHLIDKNAVIVPLTVDTRPEHPYFFETAEVDFVIENAVLKKIPSNPQKHDLLQDLAAKKHPGLIVFSSGTTGRPKAILHDFTDTIMRYQVPRQSLRTINFLFFDHLGGLNTLFHTLFNRGVVVRPSERTPAAILDDIKRHNIELLPTTPTFLRMMLLSGLLENGLPECVNLVTYGAERMDPGTLQELTALCPDVKFRQTYGSSEIGVLKIISRAKDSLWMKIVGKGVEIKVVDGLLKIRSSTNKMVNYLNAPSPFDEEGWFDTKDLVEVDGEWIRIIGRTIDVINIGGVKVLPSDIEATVLSNPNILHATVSAGSNPITGEHIELTCQLKEGASLKRAELKKFLKQKLPDSHVPHRIKFAEVKINHRFKRQ